MRNRESIREKFTDQRRSLAYAKFYHRGCEISFFVSLQQQDKRAFYRGFTMAFRKLGKLIIIWPFLRSFSGIEVPNHFPTLNYLLHTYHRPNIVPGSGESNEKENLSPYP